MKLKIVTGFILLMAYFILPGANGNRNLSSTLAVCSLALAPLTAGFYQLWIKKSVEEKVQILIVTRWRSKSEEVRSRLSSIQEESNRDSPDFSRLARLTNQLASEARDLESEVGRYNLADYTTNSVVLSVGSFLLSLADLAYPKPVWYMSEPPYPIYLSAMAACGLLAGIWYMLKNVITWQEIVHARP